MVIEIAANATTTLSIFLAMRNSVHTWWTGIVGSLLFLTLFAHSQLYADSVLQAFFIVTSLIGWWQWSHLVKGVIVSKPVTWSGITSLVVLGWVALIAWVIYGGYLETTNDFAPHVDAGIFALSMVGQYLLMQRKVETWAVWIVVNTISVILYAIRGLELTALLYFAYLINAGLGLYRWRKEVVTV